MSSVVMFRGKGVDHEVATMLTKFEKEHDVTVSVGKLTPCRHRHGERLSFVGLTNTGARLKAYSTNGYADVYVATNATKANAIKSAMTSQAKSSSAVNERKEDTQQARGLAAAAVRDVDPLAWTKSDQPSSGWMTITPEQAGSWLNQLNTHNRPIQETRIEQYADDMRAGRWNGFSHQGIAFHGNPFVDVSNAVLLDGQNRLFAITIADVPVQLLVTINLPMEAQRVMDSGMVRSAVDVFRLENPSQHTSARHAAVARAMIDPLWRNKYGRAQVVEAMERHSEVIQFVVETAWRNSGKRRLAIASTLAVAARAAYTQDREKITRFAEILLSGLTAYEHESAALLLRNWLIGDNVRRQRASGAAQAEIYLKSQTALRRFLDGVAMSRNLYATNYELFPLPGEEPVTYAVDAK